METYIYLLGLKHDTYNLFDINSNDASNNLMLKNISS